MAKDKFIGTWELVTYEARNPGGKVVYPLGEDPAGMLIYTSDGYMSANLMSRSRPEFTREDQSKASPDEMITAYRSYDSYCGTYEINEEKSSISHHVTLSKFPNWTGREQVRQYAFSNDKLTLCAQTISASGIEWTLELVWRRKQHA